MRPIGGWRIFRLSNGWGAAAFDPSCEELYVDIRVAPQGADDGQTIPTSSIADHLFSQEGEAPQAVLRACERHTSDLKGPTQTPKEETKWLEEA